MILCQVAPAYPKLVVSNVYRNKDAPRFVLGHSVVLGYLGISLVGTIVHYMLLRRENRLRRAGLRDHWTQGKTAAQISLLGDKRYVVQSIFQSNRTDKVQT